MADGDDFTFCSVIAEEDAKTVAQNISGIKIVDEPSNGVGQANGILWKDKLPRNNIQQNEGTVGALSFTVINASAKKQVNQHVSQGNTENIGTSANALLVPKTPARKSTPRVKVPFEKGYSQMDWMRLTRTHPDLAGLNGQSDKRLIALDEVKQHKTGDSMWTVLKGRVYNIAPYMKFHPGGVDMLIKAVGRDCTSLFNKHHAWVNDEFLLEKCLVGTLADSK